MTHIDEILGNIHQARGEAYDKLMVTLHQNIDQINKEQLLVLFNELLQDVKNQNATLEHSIRESNNIDLAVTYAHNTRNHIGKVDATVDNILSNNMQAEQTISENRAMFK